jgi:hypothetical protein
VLSLRFNHVKASVVHDTWPKMMRLCFPNVGYELDKTDWFAELPNRSQVWFGGLDEKERTEKILGQEYATILSERGEPDSVRVAQHRDHAPGAEVHVPVGGVERLLRLLELADCNPPPKAHWGYRLFIEKRTRTRRSR